MKKILLATALAAVSISATEANWGGFYARGGLSGGGSGLTLKKDDKAVKADPIRGEAGDGFELASLIEVSAGWGMTVAGSVYLGVDAQVANFALHYKSEEGTESATNFAWAPNLQARIGYAGKSFLPYIAGGFGAIKS
jgi:opacity protein-like surface antigen